MRSTVLLLTVAVFVGPTLATDQDFQTVDDALPDFTQMDLEDLVEHSRANHSMVLTSGHVNEISAAPQAGWITPLLSGDGAYQALSRTPIGSSSQRRDNYRPIDAPLVAGAGPWPAARNGGADLVTVSGRAPAPIRPMLI